MARHLEKLSNNESLWTVLSIQPHWSDLVCRGLKDIENRSWLTDYRGRLYIHASGSPMTPAESRPLRESVPDQLQALTDGQRQRTQEEAQQRQQSYLSSEIDKLDLWAEDLKNGRERRIKELEVSIKETKKASSLAITLEDKLALQKQVKELEAERNQARR
jgi:hypothetical protein